MNDFYDRFNGAGIIQQLIAAVVILLVTWILARVVKWAIGKLVGRIGVLQKQGNDGQSLGASLGTIASLLVWLFGLIAILQVFRLDQVLAPVQNLLGNIMGYLPNVIGAGFLFFIGFMLAKIVKQLVETALGTVNLDGLAAKIGMGDAGDQEPGAGPGTKIASLLANLIFAVILIVVSIAALQILGISAISDPAQMMLTIILNTIPLIIAAAIILAIGVVIARFAATLLEETLRGLGTDGALRDLDIVPEGRSASSILARVAQVAILLFFAIMAARVLNFPEVTQILNEVLSLGGRVIFGAVIIAVGFVLAGVLARLVGSGTASQVLRYATIVLFVAMGLQFMGIADSVITLAFGAIVVGAALAGAIAFGLGGRDAAARALGRMESAASSSTPDGPSDPA